MPSKKMPFLSTKQEQYSHIEIIYIYFFFHLIRKTNISNFNILTLLVFLESSNVLFNLLYGFQSYLNLTCLTSR